MKFRIQFSNTQPLETVYDAPVIATKAHFLDIDRQLNSKICLMRDKYDDFIIPDSEIDNINLAVE